MTTLDDTSRTINVESDLRLGSYNVSPFRFINLSGMFLHKKYNVMQNSVSLKCQVPWITKMLLMVCVLTSNTPSYCLDCYK